MNSKWGRGGGGGGGGHNMAETKFSVKLTFDPRFFSQ